MQDIIEWFSFVVQNLSQQERGEIWANLSASLDFRRLPRAISKLFDITRSQQMLSYETSLYRLHKVTSARCHHFQSQLPNILARKQWILSSTRLACRINWSYCSRYIEDDKSSVRSARNHYPVFVPLISSDFLKGPIRWNLIFSDHIVTMRKAGTSKNIWLIDDELFESLLFQNGDLDCEEMGSSSWITGGWLFDWTAKNYF
jgi:hypothetical protein